MVGVVPHLCDLVRLEVRAKSLTVLRQGGRCLLRSWLSVVATLIGTFGVDCRVRCLDSSSFERCPSVVDMERPIAHPLLRRRR